MKRLFFVYISIFIFSLLLIVNGLQTEENEDEIALPTQTEQLSESDEIATTLSHEAFIWVPTKESQLPTDDVSGSIKLLKQTCIRITICRVEKIFR